MKLFEQKTQNRIVDILLACYAVVFIIYISIPVFDLYKISWQLNDSIATLLFIVIVLLYLFRSKINFSFKANAFVVVLILSGFREALYVDVYKGYLVLMISLVVAAYFLPGKLVLWYLSGSIVIGSIISILLHVGALSDIVQVADGGSNYYWIEQIVLFSLMTSLFIWALVAFRKNVNDAISQSEQETIKFKPLFEQSYSFVYLLDFNGNILEVNQAALFYVNKKIGELKGKYFPATSWWSHSEVEQMKIEKALEACKNGDFKRFETTHKNTDAIIEYFDYTLKPIFDEDFSIKYIIAEGRDITKAKKTEQALLEGEERLIALSESTYEGLIITDNGILVEANRAALKMFKIDKIEDIVGKNTLTKLVHPDYLYIVKYYLENSIAEPYEVLALKSTGEVFPIEIQGRNIIYKGKTHRISAIRDLTERKKAQKALVESEEKYRLITENINDIICKLDYKLNFTFVSSSVFNILGYTTDEVYSKDLKQLTTSESFLEMLGHFEKKKQYIKEGNDRAWANSAFEAVLINKDGTKQTMHLNAKLVKLGDDNNYEILCVARNIDDIKQIQFSLEESKNLLSIQNIEYQRLNDELKILNKELTIAKNKAEESDKLKGAFLANMSHEIRTPLNSIIGFSKLLQRSDLEMKKMQSYAGFVANNGQILLGIVNDVLDLSKIESEQIRIKSEDVNINLLIDFVYSNFQEENNKALLCSVKKGLPNNSLIVTDGNRLLQVLQNLTNNAYKFTKKGSVSFGYSIINGFLLFYVEDTGIGISAENQEKIFERFRQVEMETSRVFGGAGLGLSISKRLVEIMGGKMWVKSSSGNGSTFYFSLPYVPSEKQEQAQPANYIKIYASPKKQLSTILVAEDDQSNYEYLKELLIGADYRVVWVKNGADAVEKCTSSNDIDLVLMDIKMPIMDGLEATRRIKEKKPHIPIIAQTAFAMSDDMDSALSCGCNDYLSKPIDPLHLMSKIRQYL